MYEEMAARIGITKQTKAQMNSANLNSLIHDDHEQLRKKMYKRKPELG